MTTDINDAAGQVIDLTNKLGTTAAGIQHATEATRTARDSAALAARHPGALAALGCALLVAAAVLALRRAGAQPPSSQLQASRYAR